MSARLAAQVALQAFGGNVSDETLALAVAIAGGESGWDPTILGDTTITDDVWGPSVGLWQIRSLRAETGTGGPRDATRLKDPAFNAASMVNVSGGGSNWRPWTIYLNGAYTDYLPEARQAVAWARQNPAAPSGGGGVIGAVTGGVGAVAGALNPVDDVKRLLAPLSEVSNLVGRLADRGLWARAGYLAFGGVMAIVAFGVLLPNRRQVVGQLLETAPS